MKKPNRCVKPLLAMLLITQTLLLTRCNSPEPEAEIGEVMKCDTVYIHDTVFLEKQALKQAVEKNKNRATAKAESPKAEEAMAKHIPLTILVENLASPTAPVVMGLYRSKVKFLDVKARIKEYKFTPQGNTLKATIADLDYGDLAFAIYQDENSNGAIDKNFLGVPKEGYAFSNNFKPKIKAPSYENCKFIYDGKSNVLRMKMIR